MPRTIQPFLQIKGEHTEVLCVDVMEALNIVRTHYPNCYKQGSMATWSFWADGRCVGECVLCGGKDWIWKLRYKPKREE